MITATRTLSLAHNGKERTKSQVLAGDATYGGVLPTRTSYGWYSKVRKMRKDPTISMARDLVITPLLASEWSVGTKKDAPVEQKDFLDEWVLPAIPMVMETALGACIDFGWAPFEKVFDFTPKNEHYIRKYKSLLNDITEILVEEETGTFAGFKQGEIEVPLEASLLLNINVEGTDWYGTAVSPRAEAPYDNWLTVEGAAQRYDKKVAGSHWVIKYPIGSSTFNGVETDNFDIAKALLASLTSSGQIVVPKKVSDTLGDITNTSPDDWDISLLSDQGTQQAAFVDRQRYLDALKVRAFGLPERAVLGGQFGTKAEAEAHMDFAIVNMENRRTTLLRLFNWHATNQMLRLNYGEENTAWIEAPPLSDQAKAMMKAVYMSIMSNPEASVAEMDSIDLDSMRTSLGVPTKARNDPGIGELMPNADPASLMPMA